MLCYIYIYPSARYAHTYLKTSVCDRHRQSVDFSGHSLCPFEHLFLTLYLPVYVFCSCLAWSVRALAFVAWLDLFWYWLLVGRLVGWSVVGWLVLFVCLSCCVSSRLVSGLRLVVCICCDEIDNVNVYRIYVCISISMLYINQVYSSQSLRYRKKYNLPTQHNFLKQAKRNNNYNAINAWTYGPFPIPPRHQNCQMQNVPPRILYRKVQSINIIQNNDQPGIDSLSWIVAPAAAAPAVAAAPRPAQQCPALDPTDPAARGTYGPPY